MRQPTLSIILPTYNRVALHLLRAAAGDAARWLTSVASADWERAFLAELRLRFFKGFVWTRLAR